MQVITPRPSDLGDGFMVHRALPSMARRAVGPFVFLDEFGPVQMEPGRGMDVRPHPHIGLSTVTYLFEGEILHRDSLGSVAAIRPGEVNWMTAGRGIVHSERTPDDLRAITRRSHGLQLWAGLPAEHEEDAPSFSHTPAASIPSGEVGGAAVRVLIGSAFGLSSPVPTLSPTLYVDIALPAGASLTVPAVAEERALYGIDNAFTLDGEAVPPGVMVVLPESHEPRLQAEQGARVMMIGGAPLGHRFMWWNFVSSRKERIVQAGDDWAAQRFERVPGETEFIPLPQRP